MNDKKTIEISSTKALAIVIGAVLSTSVATAFGVISTLNNDHFRLITVASDVTQLQEIVVPRPEIDSKFDAINQRLDRIENKIDQILADIK